MQVAEKHGSLKVVVYEGLKWHHRQAQEDSRQTKKKTPPNRNKAAVSAQHLILPLFVYALQSNQYSAFGSACWQPLQNHGAYRASQGWRRCIYGPGCVIDKES